MVPPWRTPGLITWICFRPCIMIQICSRPAPPIVLTDYSLTGIDIFTAMHASCSARAYHKPRKPKWCSG